jgi:hypothetical protein
MLLHGFDTNPEFGGDLFVGFAFGNQLKHAPSSRELRLTPFRFGEWLYEVCSDSAREDIWRSTRMSAQVCLIRYLAPPS